MTLVARLLGATILVVVIAVVAGICMLVLVYAFSRGFQLFMNLFGKEVGSLFDWMFGGLLKKMGFEKRKKGESGDPGANSTAN